MRLKPVNGSADPASMSSVVRRLECGVLLADGRGDFIGHLAAVHPETRSGRLAADLLDAMARGAISQSAETRTVPALWRAASLATA